MATRATALAAATAEAAGSVDTATGTLSQSDGRLHKQDKRSGKEKKRKGKEEGRRRAIAGELPETSAIKDREIRNGDCNGVCSPPSWEAYAAAPSDYDSKKSVQEKGCDKG